MGVTWTCRRPTPGAQTLNVNGRIKFRCGFSQFRCHLGEAAKGPAMSAVVSPLNRADPSDLDAAACVAFESE